MPATGPAAGAEPKPPTAARGWWHGLGTLVREFGKFGTVGSVAFTVDFIIFNVLLRQGSETLTAKTISTLLAATLAFTGNRFWTWRHRERRNLVREYALFFVLNTIGLGIGLACLAISHYGLGAVWPVLRTPLADNISGLLVGTALGTAFRFWSYRRYVFRDTSITDPAAVARAAGRGTAA